MTTRIYVVREVRTVDFAEMAAGRGFYRSVTCPDSFRGGNTLEADSNDHRA